MNKKKYDKLREYIESTLNAHKRALWDRDSVRKTISKIIVKKFKKYMESDDKT